MQMQDVDAAEILSAPQLAGTWVQGKGSAKQMVGRVAGGVVGGVAGSMAGSAATGELRTGPPSTPALGRNAAFVAVSERELVLMLVHRGFRRAKIGEVLARANRSDVASAELGGGVLALPLTIAFANGATWTYEVPRAGKEDATKVVEMLTSRS